MLELANRLEAFADARLGPSMAATARKRTNVMNAAHRRAALVAGDSTFGAASATTATIATPAAERRSASARTWRRPVVAILAATLAVAMLAGTVSASKPGGPLYATRLWIEMANLPADVVARAQAEINRLDARIQEAQQASAAGDGPATSAALTAYSVIVVEAARGSAGDPTASAAIEVTTLSGPMPRLASSCAGFTISGPARAIVRASPPAAVRLASGNETPEWEVQRRGAATSSAACRARAPDTRDSSRSAAS